MKECGIKSENIRLLGRMDTSNDPICLDWTGSGFEVNFKGTELWAELEAPAGVPDMWVAVCSDGYPISRFLVEKERRWYPLGRWSAPAPGMQEDTLSRVVTLMKETQPMPFAPEATVKVYGLRHDGELLPLPEPALRVEFIGDSLSSAEGALAPANNTEWIPMWFTACGNYSHYACRALNAERRVLSQSGRGVCWDFMFQKEGNMADGYEQIVGPMKGEAAEARGCQKPYDFSSWKADVVCIRLLSNDVGGMRRAEKVEEMTPALIDGCAAFIKKVRACNPEAHIIWILPATETMPEIGVAAVEHCQKEGMDRLSYFAVPDYGEKDLGARNHPNAAYNERIGALVAEEIRRVVGKGLSII